MDSSKPTGSGSFQPLFKLPQGPLKTPPQRPHNWRAAALRIAAITAAVATVGVLLATYLWLDELKVFDLSEQQLSLIANVKPGDNSLIFDRNGQKIGELFNNYHVYAAYKDLPKDLINAIIATEDRSFFTHHGYDTRGIARAMVVHLTGRVRSQGASTLTQQVVRNFLLPTERTLQRKVQEVALAVQLERRLSKEQIFEIYANAMFLGHGSYGVGAAAYRYFGKRVEALETHEAALIAGLFQSPSRYNPRRYEKRAKRRQVQVLTAMRQAGMITPAQWQELSDRPLIYKEYRPINQQTAPYFIDFVKEQAQKLLGPAGGSVGQGLRIYTTLDSGLQKMAEHSVAAADVALNEVALRTAKVTGKDGRSTNATLEAALLSVDPASGEILAMVGGRQYAKSQFNRTYQALRSPGSVFKPVVYAQALQHNWKWSDVIFVSPITIDNYRPRTPDEDFGKETTLLRAFYRSMNTPTVELGQKLGLTRVLEQARTLGIRSPLKEEFGSMLGSSDVTMMDLSRLYSSFANSGTLVEHVAITKILGRSGDVLYAAPAKSQRSKVVLSPQIAYLMTQGMRAVLQMGTGIGAAHLSQVAAGKTGTSNESTDNWFCGYTPNLATVVWVGTDEHAQIYGDVTGGKLALPIWDRFMTNALKERPAQPFVMPAGVTTAVIHPKFGNRSAAGVRMFFLQGHEPSGEVSALEEVSQSVTGYRDVFSK